MSWEHEDYDDDGYCTCEHCGRRYPIEVGMPSHLCEAGSRAFEKQNAEYEKAFKGKGKCRGVLIIEYECFDSEEAFSNLMDMVELDGCRDIGKTEGSDSLMGCKWKTEHRREKIK